MTKFERECLEYKGALNIKRVASLQNRLNDAIHDNEPPEYIDWFRAKITAQLSQSVRKSGSSV